MNKKYNILFLSILFLFSCSDEGINPVYGCIDENALNYCEECNIDDGSCMLCDDSPINNMTGYDDCFTYTYDENIYDIFNQNGCLSCHNQGSYTGLDLSTYTGTMTGGNNGPIISDMSPSTSLLITTFSATGYMCENESYCEVPSESIIEIWISEGTPE